MYGWMDKLLNTWYILAYHQKKTKKDKEWVYLIKGWVHKWASIYEWITKETLIWWIKDKWNIMNNSAMPFSILHP